VRSWTRRDTVSLLVGLILGLGLGHAAWARIDARGLSQTYQEQVDRRLTPPPEEVQRYGALALDMLSASGLAPIPAQYVAVVDRNRFVQAVFIYWVASDAAPVLIGASPVSTGRVGQFDHFETPIGVFEHTPKNPDFRAEGTKNKLGIRGYGSKDMRVFDFGWQLALRGWGDGETSEMRLQMHATDPDLLEKRLGSVQSKGCIRIPATLDRWLDHFGVLDAEYESSTAPGPRLWVLSPDREPVPEAGRYLIVVDTARSARPDWSPAPH
jgi:hypothetical protein